ncbi:MAG: aminotransferase class I/II-fold pyridoxal phosphate-dependent enzyme [Treponemataceae bacterium]
MIHPLAQELNDTLHPCIIGRSLSAMGQRLYFPKGIIAQSAEAKQTAKKGNATIGMALQEGIPMILPCVKNEFATLENAQIVSYAPTAGNPDLQKAWKNALIEKNPLLKNKSFSLPVVTPGLTAGVSLIADLFLNEGETLLVPFPSWDNYALIVESRKNAIIESFNLFAGGQFDLLSFEKKLSQLTKTSKKISILLNFPQNPSGYSPTKEEVAAIKEILLKTAIKGTDIILWCDDAYFNLTYENTIEKQSLFAHFADAHENILAIKIDGSTKEDFVWGFRTGFLTFSTKDLTANQYEALNKKLMGAIRTTVSCCSTPAQSIMLKAMQNPSFKSEKEAFKKIIKERYQLVRQFVDAHKDHPLLQALPFNSGYFMTFFCKGINAEDLRQHLLRTHEIGTIAIDSSHLRIAFSSLNTDAINDIYATIYKAAQELAE